MSKFLVTDPCYIVTHEEWDRLGNETGWGDEFIEALRGYKGINQFGQPFKILFCDGTENGDGSLTGTTTKGEAYDIGVDAGLVCLAEIDSDFTTNGFGAIVGGFVEGNSIYAEAKRI